MTEEKAENLKRLRAALAAAETRAAVQIDDESEDAWARAIEFQREIEELEKPRDGAEVNLATPTRTTRVVKCQKCGCVCGNLYWLCDLTLGEWCGACFGETACGEGAHGEGCPTQVFDNSTASAGETNGTAPR